MKRLGFQTLKHWTQSEYICGSVITKWWLSDTDFDDLESRNLRSRSQTQRNVGPGRGLWRRPVRYLAVMASQGVACSPYADRTSNHRGQHRPSMPNLGRFSKYVGNAIAKSKLNWSQSFTIIVAWNSLNWTAVAARSTGVCCKKLIRTFKKLATRMEVRWKDVCCFLLLAVKCSVHHCISWIFEFRTF